MSFDIKKITREIRSQLEYTKNDLNVEETGVITQISDGIVHIHGLKNCVVNELVTFEDGSNGLVMSLMENSVLAISLSDSVNLKENDIVRRTRKEVSVPVGNSLLGRVVNSLGVAQDGRGDIRYTEKYPIERPSKGIMKRKSVSRPLETGIKAIDSMIPIGLGQRELIIGDRQTGKTSIALSTIINQRDKNIVCIYVAIGRKKSTTAEIVDTLHSAGAMENTVIVAAPASDPVALQYIAPFAACSMGEYFMEQGRDVLIIYDDLTQHAMAYRTISLLLKRPPGREAYPGDVFYLHSRLLERAGALSDSLGGGTLTALPIIETQVGNISAYIPTNVISITDGQIFLETDLFNAGILPAVNPGISVSRVGGTAQIKAMRSLSGKLKLLYSQYMELESFAQFGSDLDEHTKRRLEIGEKIIEVLKQSENVPVSTAKQVAIFYALLNNYLDHIPLDKVKKYESALYGYIEIKADELMKEIYESKDFDVKLQQRLGEFITQFTKEFMIKNDIVQEHE